MIKVNERRQYNMKMFHNSDTKERFRQVLKQGLAEIQYTYV